MNKLRKNKSIRRTILILLDLVLILFAYNINFLIINHNNPSSDNGNINILQMIMYTFICIFTIYFLDNINLYLNTLVSLIYIDC